MTHATSIGNATNMPIRNTRPHEGRAVKPARRSGSRPSEVFMFPKISPYIVFCE